MLNQSIKIEKSPLMINVKGDQFCELPKNSQKAPNFSYGEEWLNIV